MWLLVRVFLIANCVFQLLGQLMMMLQKELEIILDFLYLVADSTNYSISIIITNIGLSREYLLLAIRQNPSILVVRHGG